MSHQQNLERHKHLPSISKVRYKRALWVFSAYVSSSWMLRYALSSKFFSWNINMELQENTNRTAVPLLQACQPNALPETKKGQKWETQREYKLRQKQSLKLTASQTNNYAQLQPSLLIGANTTFCSNMKTESSIKQKRQPKQNIIWYSYTIKLSSLVFNLYLKQREI